MEDDDPRRSMPVMYQRQEEMRDGSRHFYGNGPDYFELRRQSARARVDPVKAKRRKLGRWLLLGNIALILIALGVFYWKSRPAPLPPGLSVATIARVYQDQVLARTSIQLPDSPQARALAGQVASLSVWLDRSPGFLVPFPQAVPESAFFDSLVLPAMAEEELAFNKRFSLPADTQAADLAVYVLLEWQGGRYSTVVKVKEQ